MGEFVQRLETALRKGFIDQTVLRSDRYKPELLVNSSEQGQTVLSSIQDELRNCDEFLFSVAFITESGLAALKSIFLDLRSKGIAGRIITSTYLYFNQPKVFTELAKIENVEVRLSEKDGFHSKGYIFKRDEQYSLIVGSSNLTAHALQVNYEWNVKLTSHRDGEIVSHFTHQFESVWNDSVCMTPEWIAAYELLYRKHADQTAFSKVKEHPSAYEVNPLQKALEITPNAMQQTALRNIQGVREQGHKRSIVISATGTGKTYLAAFDVRQYQPERMLFIVHREQILQKAIQDFKQVLGASDDEFGLYTGSSRQQNKKYVFATVQTLSKPENLAAFSADDFDYILIDEVHKAGADSYLRIIDHFQPQFLLGMTATPERSDDFNIYALFDYNIAYEIRLQEALEENMLSPFHYFGVTDFEKDGEVIDDFTELNKLVTNERAAHIIDKLTYYGYSGESVRGLIFCSRKEEAHDLSRALNLKGLRTAALTGGHSQEERAECVQQLENGQLEYILTVDIFNEGIDIPSVNQVVMLRQTQSSIIFIQQLGRGLRKHPGKEFVTVIDFIGNYANNYLIPVALSGDRSMNKDKIRRYMKDTSYIKGVSTINFEEVAQKKIFSSISQSNLTSLKILRDAYQNVKNKVGRIPYLYDFIEQHSIDPVVIAEKHANYYEFLLRMKEDIAALSAYERCVLTMFSLEVLNGKRLHEIVLAGLLFERGAVAWEEWTSALRGLGCTTDDETLESVLRVYDLSFFTEQARKKYGNAPIIEAAEDGLLSFNQIIRESIAERSLFAELLQDVLRSASVKAENYRCSEPLTLHAKYSRKDVCRLLNWQADESSTMYGYKTKHGTCPIFVTYDKHENVEASVNYGDAFVSPELFTWYTRSNRTLKSKEVQAVIQAQQTNTDIHLFVKKDDDEGTDFYYLGKSIPDTESVAEGFMADGKPVVHMNMVMEHPVERKLYDYLIEA